MFYYFNLLASMRALLTTSSARLFASSSAWVAFLYASSFSFLAAISAAFFLSGLEPAASIA